MDLVDAFEFDPHQEAYRKGYDEGFEEGIKIGCSTAFEEGVIEGIKLGHEVKRLLELLEELTDSKLSTLQKNKLNSIISDLKEFRLDNIQDIDRKFTFSALKLRVKSFLASLGQSTLGIEDNRLGF